MPEDPAPGTMAGSKRRRDATSYVVMRKPKAMVVGRAHQADADAEAYARFIGSWGNFSAHIGDQWERVASARAGALVGSDRASDAGRFILRHIEDLDSNDALHREVERIGVSCPDALFCGPNESGQAVVQPVDYKVSLDTASFDQVEAERILDLASRGGDNTVAAIWRAVTATGALVAPVAEPRASLLAFLQSEAITPIGGLFVAPDTAFNRVHLRGPENRRRQRPLRPDDVLLLQFAPIELLSGLPGWEEAQELMRLDHVRADLPGDLGMAERYARLGSGAKGALRTIRSPLFGPAPIFDGAAELRMRISGQQTSLDVLRALQEGRARRLDLLARRDKLMRFPFRMATLAEAMGLTGGEGEERQPWPMDVLRNAMDDLHGRHRHRLEETGLELLASGRSDEEVVTRLEAEWPAFRRAAEADIAQWAAGGPTDHE